MPKKLTFPKELLVRVEEDGNSSYFIAHENVTELTDYDGETVAVYKLVERRKIAVDVSLNGKADA